MEIENIAFLTGRTAFAVASCFSLGEFDERFLFPV